MIAYSTFKKAMQVTIITKFSELKFIAFCTIYTTYYDSMSREATCTVRSSKCNKLKLTEICSYTVH